MVAALLITAIAGITVWLVFFKFKWLRFSFAWAFALSFFSCICSWFFLSGCALWRLTRRTPR